MRCETCRELLSPFLDEVCSEKENKMVEAHLAVCPGCRDQLAELRSLIGAFHQLDLPSLPEGFAESLHRRLNAENLIFFPPQEFKVPRRQSWIAAAIAGLALAGGIYASTVLPLGSMIASWGDKGQNTDNKPHVAINDVIKDVTQKNGVDVANNDTAATNKGQTQTAGTSDKTNTTDAAEGPTGTGIAGASTDVGQAEKLFAKSSSVAIEVKNASESRQQVIQIAAANGLGYSFSNKQAAMSGPATQGITLNVEPQDVDKIMQQLAAVGQMCSPAQNTVDLSDKLASVENKLDQAQAAKDSLTKEGITDQEQASINELDTRIKTLAAQKAQLEKEASMVTINIYFKEDVNP